MKHPRHCSKPGCQGGAVATLTYDYADQMLVIGPLARQPEPFTYDLCQQHVERLTAPQGWQVIRLHTRFDEAPLSPSDPEALLRAVQTPPAAPLAQGSEATAGHCADEPTTSREDARNQQAIPTGAPSDTGVGSPTHTSAGAASDTGAAEYTATVLRLPVRNASTDEGNSPDHAGTPSQGAHRASTPATAASTPEYGPFGKGRDEA